MKNVKQMKIWKLLLATCFIFAGLTSAAQSQKLTAGFVDRPAKEVIDFLKEKTQKSFFYSSSAVDVNQNVTIKVNNGTLEDILKMLAGQIKVDFEIKENVIILTPAKKLQKAEVQTTATDNPSFRSISGKVIDETGQGVISATVTYLENGELKGVLTDFDGNFTAKLPSSVTTLTVKMIGYQDYVIALNDKTNYNIALKQDLKDLDEVVITGFQNVDRREFTGSVKKIEMDEIQQPGLESVDKMLQGQVAGVQIENVSGTTGSRTKIRIRGNSSLSGNREPLWVVDGIVLEDAVKINPNELYSGDPSTLISSAIGGLNPNDIESISILKDASATALYGTQAVNGVIVITTKKGKKDQFAINYSGNFTTSQKPQIENFHMMNSAERMDLAEELFDRDLVDFSHLDYYAGGFGMAYKQYNNKELNSEEFQRELYRLKKVNTDWFDLLFKNSFKMEHNLSISSGTERSQYYFSLNYFKDLGNTIGQNTDRYIANFRSNYVLGKKVTVGAKVNISSKDQTIFNSSANPYVYALNTSRAIPQYKTDGSDYYYTNNKTDFNIFNEIDNSFANLNSLDATIQMDLNWKVFKGANFNSIVSYRRTFNHTEKIYTEKSNVANAYRDNPNTYFQDVDDDDAPIDGITILPRGGILQTLDNRSKFFTNRNSLSWSKIFNSHKLDLFAGEEYRSTIYDHGYNTGYGYEYYRGKTANPNYNAIKRNEVYGLGSYYGLNTSPAYKFSIFGTATYSYNSKYTLNMNMRSDGSNQFGNANRFRFLPIWSLGGNWNITSEGFMENQSFFNNLALRGSYGLRGNVSGNYTPQVLAYYGMSYALDPADKEETLYVVHPPNPDLQWEKEFISNIAIDFELKNKMSGSVEYYNRSNHDLISEYPVSYVSGFQNVNLNWASMRNSGFEVAFNTQNITTKNFNWSTNFTLGYNKNEVLEAFYVPTIRTLANENLVAPVEGRPMTGIYAFKFAGLDDEGVPMVYDGEGNKVYGMDLSSRDIDALEYMGSKEPLYSGGLTNTFNYKNFNLSLLFVYSGGNKIRLNSIYEFYYADIDNVSKEMVNRWQIPGDENYTHVPAILDLFKQNELLQAGYDVPFMYNNSNIRVVDGSYIKLRNVALGWNMNKNKPLIPGMKEFQIQLQAQNLWTIANKDLNGKDPEALIQGASLPLVPTYTLGIKASF